MAKCFNTLNHALNYHQYMWPGLSKEDAEVDVALLITTGQYVIEDKNEIRSESKAQTLWSSATKMFQKIDESDKKEKYVEELAPILFEKQYPGQEYNDLDDFQKNNWFEHALTVYQMANFLKSTFAMYDHISQDWLSKSTHLASLLVREIVDTILE